MAKLEGVKVKKTDKAQFFRKNLISAGKNPKTPPK